MVAVSAPPHRSRSRRRALRRPEGWLLLAVTGGLLVEVHRLRLAVEKAHRERRATRPRLPLRSRAYRGHRRPDPGDPGGTCHGE